MSSRSKVTLASCIAIGLLLAALLALQWRSAAVAATTARNRGTGQPVPVRAATARRGPIDISIDALGTVTAGNTAAVHARVDGQLLKLNFQEGRDVKAGAVLAELDPRPLQAARDQAQGQLAKDTALLTSARNDLTRYKSLLAEDSIARQQVDDQAALVQQYAGSVQADRGALANAQLQLAFTRITAPISGRTGLRQVDIGNMVHANDVTGVVVITSTAPINVLFSVPADRAPQITQLWLNHSVLGVDAYDRDGRVRIAHGSVASIDNVVDSATNTVKVKAQFANDDGALFPNEFVNARLTIATQNNQILIPVSAVQRGAPGTFVYAINANASVSIRPIVLGTSQGAVVAVTHGLALGERVVIEGTDKLREGSKVELIEDAPTATASRPHRRRPAGAQS